MLAPMSPRRHVWKLTSSLVVAAWLVGGGVPAWGAVQTYMVTSTADIANSSPTSKVCATAGTNPVCTLRAAIQASNANSGTDTIILPAGVYTLTIAGRNEDAAATGDLDITDPVNITGVAGSTIIDGNGIDRVFDVFASGTTTISGVTIRNGNPGGFCSATATQFCLADTDCPQGETCVFNPGGKRAEAVLGRHLHGAAGSRVVEPAGEGVERVLAGAERWPDRLGDEAHRAAGQPRRLALAGRASLRLRQCRLGAGRHRVENAHSVNLGLAMGRASCAMRAAGGTPMLQDL